MRLKKASSCMGAGRRILVTGGAGYIGAHCCKAVREAGFEPVCYDNLAIGHRSFVNWGPLVTGDILDERSLVAALREFEIQAVIHLAASSLVGESVSHPHIYYRNNVVGTLTLLDSMRKAGCSNIVFSSTGAVYGEVPRMPIREAQAGHAVNPYGRSKWMAEQIIGDFEASYGFNAIRLRYFNACGADDCGLIGELRDPETHLIPRALMVIQGHLDEFAVYGDDYDTPDGSAVRDYIHVSDLADAHVRAIHALMRNERKIVGRAFNLGTGKGYSVKEVLHAIERETGSAPPTTMKDRRPGDPSTLVADPTAANDDLQFRPLRSDLHTIIRSAWAWHTKAHPRRVREL